MMVMGKRNFKITDARGGTAIPVRVVTQSETSGLAGVQEDGMLKVRLTASPAGDPAANAELISLLSEVLGIPQDKIEVVVGASAREKILSVEGLTTDEVESRLGIT
jgi:uncharacterized protein YggU (UPF0235/DUF167 family)